MFSIMITSTGCFWVLSVLSGLVRLLASCILSLLIVFHIRAPGVRNVIPLSMVNLNVPILSPFGQPGRETCPSPSEPVIGPMRSAFRLMTADVEPAKNVPGGMSARGVGAQIVENHAPSVAREISLQPVRQLSPTYWEAMLAKVYDSATADSILNDIVNGVYIGRAPADQVVDSKNWPSALEFREKVSQVISADLDEGKLYGPFEVPPYQNYIISPLGAFLKRDRQKVRVIHDLSYPHADSVNALIDPEEFSVQYSSVDDAVKAIQDSGDPYLCKIDLKDAYKAVGIHPSDWHLLGFRWDLMGLGDQVYFSKVLTFGLRSAPAIFGRFGGALELFMADQGVESRVVRYVDDFLLIAESESLAANHLDIMITVARQAGFAIQDTKVTPPTKVAEFLGIVIDVQKSELRISEERVSEIRALLAAWRDRQHSSKRKLLKLIGKLAFAARVIRSGRAFLGRLIGISKKVKGLHHRVKISGEARRDIIWWDRCLESHNGVSTTKIDWSVGEVEHVYTDASNFGYGGVWNGEWFAMQYIGEEQHASERSINWRELHAALRSLATWAPRLRGKKVMYHIDNTTACYLLNRLYSPVVDLMEFVRQWCLLVETYEITMAVVYISTHKNTLADLLSRGELGAFAELHSATPSTRVWPSKCAYFDDLV